MAEIESLVQGCLVGAFVGDAAGARLEFLGRRPDNAQLDDALAMKGGGVFRVAPGQVTDDGELTLALARVILGEQEYPREKVATNYGAWVASRPFDIGKATSSALGGAAVDDSEEVADAVATNAAKHNFASKANGALMRSSALGIWSVRLTGVLLDRLTHCVHILEMNGESCWLATSQKRARKPGPLAPPEPNIHVDKSEKGVPPAQTEWLGLASASVPCYARWHWHRQIEVSAANQVGLQKPF